MFAKREDEELGLHTPNAFENVKRCSDHHKTWQFLETCYVSITDELLVAYVCNGKQSHKVPSVSDYWMWNNESVNDANYLYFQQMIFTFLHALMLYKCRVRKCNALAIESGKAKLLPLFFATNRPT